MIVTHQSEASIAGTLDALVPQLDDDDELIVVDSGSNDRTTALVHEHAPRATLVDPGANVGFAAGCNLGADASAAPLLLLLNPDARPQPGCLDALRATAAEQPEWAPGRRS